MNDLFEKAVALVLAHEGGYVNDPRDPGGETIYGISRRAHPKAWEGGTPTKDEAVAIYRDAYWNKCRCDDLPPAVAVVVFDMAVNAGASRAIKMLQAQIGAVVDGVIGPKTIQAAKGQPLARLVGHYTAERILFYAGLDGWERYGTGWTRRAILTTHLAAEYIEVT